MKLTAPREALASALLPAARAAGPGSSDLLSRLRLEVTVDDGDAVLMITSGDVERSVQMCLDVVADEAVSVYVPAQLLTGLVKDLSGQNIELEITDQHVNVGHESGSYRLPVYADEGPRYERASSDTTITTTGPALSAMISRVAGAASRDTARGVLMAVKVEAEGDRLTMAATDSYRLAVAGMTIDPIAEAIEAKIPAGVLEFVAKTLAKADTVTISVDERCVTFDAGSAQITTRQSAGAYPNWKALTKNEPSMVATFDKAEFVEKAGRVARFADTIEVAIDPSGELTVTGTGVGSALEKCACTYTGDEAISLRINPGYILDAVSTTAGDTLTFAVKDPISPIWVRGSAEQTTIVMPLRK